jgi:hypothetical protein
MNVIKYITTMLVKNYNNSTKFTENDALLRDRMYGRVSKAIDLAKTLSLDIEVTREGWKVCDILNPDGEGKFKHITISKTAVHAKDLADFFYGLRRTSTVISYLSYYKHIHEGNFLCVRFYEGSASIAPTRGKADNVLNRHAVSVSQLEPNHI